MSVGQDCRAVLLWLRLSPSSISAAALCTVRYSELLLPLCRQCFGGFVCYAVWARAFAGWQALQAPLECALICRDVNEGWFQRGAVPPEVVEGSGYCSVKWPVALGLVKGMCYSLRRSCAACCCATGPDALVAMFLRKVRQWQERRQCCRASWYAWVRRAIIMCMVCVDTCTGPAIYVGDLCGLMVGCPIVNCSLAACACQSSRCCS